MDRYSYGGGCLGLVVLVAMFVILFGIAIPSLTGTVPVWTASGFTWDNTGRSIDQSNYTARYVARQENETERSAIFWDAAQRIALYGAIAAIAIVVAVQRGRTMRQQSQMRALVVSYASKYYLGEQVKVGKYDGKPALIDYARGEIVPYSTIEIEMGANETYGSWRPL